MIVIRGVVEYENTLDWSTMKDLMPFLRTNLLSVKSFSTNLKI